MLVAIVCNVVLAALLLFISIEKPDTEAGSFFTVVSIDEAPEPEREMAKGGPSSSRAIGAGARALAPPSLKVITSIAPLPSPAFKPSSMSANFHLSALESTAFERAPSLNKMDFVAIKSQEKRRIKSLIEGKSGHGGSGSKRGVGEDVLKGMFPGSALGDGSGMVVFTDKSGSMQKISEAVEKFVKANFEKSYEIEIMGCALGSRHDPFAKELARVAAADLRTDYYFICDLQDGQGSRGISSLRRTLLSGTVPKRLHIISFDKSAEPALTELIEETRGSFVYIDPFLTGG